MTTDQPHLDHQPTGYDFTFLPRDLGHVPRLLNTATVSDGLVLLVTTDEDLGEATEVIAQARTLLADRGCADAADNLAWVTHTLIDAAQPRTAPGRPWELHLPAGHVTLIRTYLRHARYLLTCGAPLHRSCTCVRIDRHDGPCNCRHPAGS